MRPESRIEDPNHNVRRIFGCGTDYSSLRAVWNKQSSNTQRRLERVAWRVWISFKLRYHIRLVSGRLLGTAEYFRSQTEVNALEVYLLFTCLDALAGAGYQAFDAWLKKVNPTGPYSLEDVLRLHTKYLNEHGVMNQLRRLFSSLPSATKQWLAENVAVTQSSVLLVTDCEGQDADVLATNILEFFYRYRRNPYTHRGQAEHIAVSPDVEWPGNEDNMWSSSAGRERQSPDTETLHLHLRGSLDEATLLRVIIHSAVYSQLGIGVDGRVIQDVLRRDSRVCALHHTLVEVEANGRLLDEWKLAGSGDRSLLRYYCLRGPSRPSSDWTKKACQRLRNDIPLEKGIRAHLGEYAQVVDKLDGKVEAFNRNHPHLDEDAGGKAHSAQTAAIQLELPLLADGFPFGTQAAEARLLS